MAQKPKPAAILTSRAAWSLVFDRALMLAAIIHAGQPRKGTRVPYVMHPFHVAMILERHGYPEPLQVAALLHDVLEDANLEPEDARRALRETFQAALSEVPDEPEAMRAALPGLIATEFGAPVLAWVEAVTEEKTDRKGRPVPWLERRAEQVKRFKRDDVPIEVIALKAADVLHNSRQVLHDIKAQGLTTMHRFKGSAEDTLRYYGNVSGVVKSRLGVENPLAHELDHAVRDLADTLRTLFTGAVANVEQVVKQLR
jgi:(p)ppGpp synthase/HD superfamily hydrolase